MATMDTLKAAQELEKAGLPKPQAEAISRIVNDLGRADLVTKDNLEAAASKLDSKIDAVVSRFEALLWKHTVAIIATVIAVGGFLLRFNH